IATALNEPLFIFFRSIRNTYTDPLMIAITFLGEKIILLPAVLLIAIWLMARRTVKAGVIYLGITLLGAGAVGVMKHLYYSARPEGLMYSEMSSSFPSGHTVLAVVVFGFLAFLIAQPLKLFWRKMIYFVAILLIALIALSRLYLGVH